MLYVSPTSRRLDIWQIANHIHRSLLVSLTWLPISERGSHVYCEVLCNPVPFFKIFKTNSSINLSYCLNFSNLFRAFVDLVIKRNLCCKRSFEWKKNGEMNDTYCYVSLLAIHSEVRKCKMIKGIVALFLFLRKKINLRNTKSQNMLTSFVLTSQEKSEELLRAPST